jgi:hypothetical protein
MRPCRQAKPTEGRRHSAATLRQIFEIKPLVRQHRAGRLLRLDVNSGVHHAVRGD